MLSEPVLVVARLARVFDALGIRYVVGGSVASSLYGIPRATQDVEVIADIRLSHVEGITNALSGAFYVDADMIRDAIKRRSAITFVSRSGPCPDETTKDAMSRPPETPGGRTRRAGNQSEGATPLPFQTRPGSRA